jgi:hypothetical protein
VLTSFNVDTAGLISSGPLLPAMAFATPRAASTHLFSASRSSGVSGSLTLAATMSALRLSDSTAGPALDGASGALALNAVTKSLTAPIESTLLEANASHAAWTASSVIDSRRWDSLARDEAADFSADADTDALYTGASVAFTVAEPPVTDVHPTMIMAAPARLPTTGARIRNCGDLVSPPVGTVFRRYRFG